ncbi:MAG: tRNA(Met) cytidine acetyltransferase, partial [Crenarchaeota archaeon]|nr:tRNA(Met) cytidine acetyltransferase [Thermoproteota archaeon]
MEAAMCDMVRRFIEQGILLNHRRMIVLSGDSDEKLIDWVYRILEEFVEVWKRCRQSTPSGLYMYQHDAPGSCRRFEYFRRRLASIVDKAEIEHRPYKDTDKLLGSTYDLAVLDIIDNLKPNDIGRLGGVVRGGGVYIVLVRPLDSWTRFLTKFQEQLLVPQYGPQDVRHLLKKRLWKKFYEHDGICIIDVDTGRMIKEPKILENVEPWKRPEIRIPDKRRFPTCIYKLALTQDQ